MIDEEVGIQIMVPRALKRELQKEALARDETMRTFVLKALRQRGLRVPSALLKDRRKTRCK